MSSGIDKAWDILASGSPETMAANSGARVDNGSLVITCLGHDFNVIPSKKILKPLSPEGEALAKKLDYFVSHCLLWYLCLARGVPETGRLVKPESVKGGGHFFRATHALPLQGLASRYGGDPDGFVEKGLMLGGRELKYGDRSVELRPMPEFPVTLILWAGDEEFPPRADLLLDSSCDIYLPLDIIWSGAMLALLAEMS